MRKFTNNIGKIKQFVNELPTGKSPRLQQSDGVLDVWVYNEIGGQFWDGVDALALNQQIASFEGSDIVVHLNSPGGDVFAGISIVNALLDAKPQVTTVVEGLAASAASLIFQAGDIRIMLPSTRQMVHKAWTIGGGNSDDFREIADILDGIDSDIAGIYADATGQQRSAIMDIMKAETWLGADESVEMGYADQIGKDEPAEIDAAATHAPLNVLKKRLKLATMGCLPESP